MKKYLVLLLATALFLPRVAMAEPTIEELQKQIAEIAAELDELSDRIDKPERHAALDRISFYGDVRVTADSLHYQDVTYNPGILVDFDDFSSKVMDPSNPNWSSFNAQLTDVGGNPQDFYVANKEGIDAGTFNPFSDETATVGDRIYAAFMQNMVTSLVGQGMSEADAVAYAQDNANNLTPVTQMLISNPAMANAFFAGQLQGIAPYALAAAARTTDINNDIMYTTRMRLGMKAQIADNMDFAGRLTMYKNWGDSTTSKVFDSWDAFTMDGTNGGSTSGDWLRVERAYFNWKDIAGSKFYLSIGRRPSTYGPPSQFRENELRGGTPTGHLVHFNFDGITAGYHLEELTGIEGQTIRFCYGQGFESEWGNGTMFNDDITKNLKDTQLGGFNVDVFNDGQTLVQATLFRAQDVVDGFKGVIAFPTQYAALFAPTMYTDLQKFQNFNFEVRYTPSTVIGDINLAALGFTREEDNGLVWFGSLAMTQLEPNGKAGMFGGLGTDAVYEAKLSEDGSEIIMVPARAEDDETQEGFGVYVGVQIPAPMGKLGLEYNYGSKYWTPFTQAQDDLLGSKLATRGHVGEIYYIFDINSNAFIKIGGLYYDYEYTGSGSPVGKPVKIDDVKNGTAYSMLPVVDTAWDLYAKMTLRF